MQRHILAAALALVAEPALAAGERIPLPSGLTVEFLDLVTDAPGMGVAWRYRFLAPDLDPMQDYFTTEADMAHLCRTYALPRLEGAEPFPDNIVITLADRPVPFGTPDPEAVQFFEAYAPEGGDCIWQE